MRVRAPGKLLLSGAYAVLEGAPAIVCAVDRYAVASRTGALIDAAPEVRAAIPDAPPLVDTGALYQDGMKLGLGSSAAAVVAALGLLAAERCEALDDLQVRARIFAEARAAHARVQHGGSGVDVAASVYGGVLRYTLDDPRPAELPPGMVVHVFFSGASARTSDLRARVEALAARDPARHASLFKALIEAAHLADEAVASGNVHAFIRAAQAQGTTLAALGSAADCAIVPPAFAALAASAMAERAAFLPSGAGGGDVAIYVGESAPSEALLGRAAELGLVSVPIGIDRGGVRVES